MIPLFEEHDLGLDLEHLHFLAGYSSGAGILGSPTSMQAQLQRWCFVRWPWKQTDAHHEANTAAELCIRQAQPECKYQCIYYLIYTCFLIYIFTYVFIYKTNYMGWSLNCNIELIQ